MNDYIGSNTRQLFFNTELLFIHKNINYIQHYVFIYSVISLHVPFFISSYNLNCTSTF